MENLYLQLSRLNKKIAQGSLELNDERTIIVSEISMMERCIQGDLENITEKETELITMKRQVREGEIVVGNGKDAKKKREYSKLLKKEIIPWYEEDIEISKKDMVRRCLVLSGVHCTEANEVMKTLLSKGEFDGFKLESILAYFNQLKSSISENIENEEHDKVMYEEHNVIHEKVTGETNNQLNSIFGCVPNSFVTSYGDRCHSLDQTNIQLQPLPIYGLTIDELLIKPQFRIRIAQVYSRAPAATRDPSICSTTLVYTGKFHIRSAPVMQRVAAPFGKCRSLLTIIPGLRTGIPGTPSEERLSSNPATLPRYLAMCS